MKIIGEASEYYVIKVTKDELANILGYYSTASSGFSYKKIKLYIEKEISIEISKIYTHHNELHALLNESHYQKARTKLKSMLDAITNVEDLLKGDIELKKLIDIEDEK